MKLHQNIKNNWVISDNLGLKPLAYHQQKTSQIKLLFKLWSLILLALAVYAFLGFCWVCTFRARMSVAIPTEAAVLPFNAIDLREHFSIIIIQTLSLSQTKYSQWKYYSMHLWTWILSALTVSAFLCVCRVCRFLAETSVAVPA